MASGFDLMPVVWIKYYALMHLHFQKCTVLEQDDFFGDDTGNGTLKIHKGQILAMPFHNPYVVIACLFFLWDLFLLQAATSSCFYAGFSAQRNFAEANNSHLTPESISSIKSSEATTELYIILSYCTPQDMVKRLFHANHLHWLERFGIKSRRALEDCRIGVEYVQSEVNHVKHDAGVVGWPTDGLIAKPLPNRIVPIDSHWAPVESGGRDTNIEQSIVRCRHYGRHRLSGGTRRGISSGVDTKWIHRRRHVHQLELQVSVMFPSLFPKLAHSPFNVFHIPFNLLKFIIHIIKILVDSSFETIILFIIILVHSPFSKIQFALCKDMYFHSGSSISASLYSWPFWFSVLDACTVRRQSNFRTRMLAFHSFVPMAPPD
ncbi:hypothetical protein RJ641_013233 [Dillenia turbinata]|uniref:Uncharacterized protein n=1 Tax=Dillenia turbinata TaxID=194707 RepID=A0AAN8ZL83_9MAGN